MKRLITYILILAPCLSMGQPALAAQPPTVTPLYTYAYLLNVSLNISDSGLASVTVVCNGKPGLKSTTVVTYLEKKVNGVWTRVDIPPIGDQWVTTFLIQQFNRTYTAQLTSRGEYRAVAKFTLVGETSENITMTATDKQRFTRGYKRYKETGGLTE